MSMIMSNIAPINRFIELIDTCDFLYFSDFARHVFTTDSVSSSDYVIVIEYADFFDRYITSRRIKQERGAINGKA